MVGRTKRIQNSFTGILIPSDWGENGRIESISLQTIDEKEYLIEKNQLEREMRFLINEKIKIRGKVRERIDGKKSILVKQYKPIDTYEGE